MLSDKWRSVRRDSLCPICQKPDWCQISSDGQAAICRRIQSAKAQTNGGWLHRLDGSIRVALSMPPRAVQPVLRHDLALLARSFATAINPPVFTRFAQDMGLSVESLRRLDVGWSIDKNAWSFPMRDAAMEIRGFRMRSKAGRKFAITGGREGLFIPRDFPDEQPTRLMICEGPTDTAALLDLGFAAIGRPSCLGGRDLILDLLKRRHQDGAAITQLVIVADGDKPGQHGAAILAGVARLYCQVVHILTPPAGVKDARQWKQNGATAADVERAVWASPRCNLKVASQLKGISQ